MKFITLLLFTILYITAAVYGEQDRHLQQQTNAPENKRYFIENKGQWDSKVLYLVRLENLDAWITRDGVVYDYYKIVNNKEGSNNIDRIKFDNPSERDFPGRKGHIFQMQYLNNQIPIEITDNSINGSGKQETYYNYFIGNDSSHWASNVSLYKEILITGVYDNIDVRYYIEDKTDINDNIPEKPGIISHLRYDFIVHPGADPSQINIIFNGQDGLIINPAGELVIGTSLGDIKQSGLTAYQDNLGSSSFDSCGSNHYDYENKAELYLNNPQFTGIIPAGFIMLSDKTIGFSVGNYDRTKDLTIDPLIFSTFIGSGGEDCAFAMTIDNSGCSYITGYTSSTTYPRTYGAYDQSYNGGAFDIFVSKLSSAGTYLVFSTYIGGADIDCGYGITLDGVNNVFITGYTWSSNYPTTPGVYDELFNGGYRDAILTKLNISGTGLMFSTFLGGTGDDYGISTVSLSGNNYIAGSTWSSNFPTIAGSYDISFNGSEDVFLSKMNSTASILTYSTYIGGTGADECHQVVIDPSGCGYITGHTASTNYPTTGDSYSQIYNGGGWDGFLTKFSSTGGELTYSTYLGGIGEDYGFALTIDNSNNPYLTGPTWSGNFPISYGAYDTDYNGGPLDAYICKMNTTGSGLVYSTFIGGSLLDQSYSIDLDNANNAVITGITSSNNDFPVTIDAFDKTFNNTITDTTSYDVFVSKVNSTGSQLLYSTYLGGIHDDESYALAVNQDNTIIVTGITNSIDFPASPGAYDPTFNGGNYDVFVTRLTLVSSSPLISTLGELDFDDVKCTNYESKAFEIINIGNSTLTISGKNFSGPNYTDFHLLSPTLPINIDPLDSALFVVKFQTSIVGSKEAYLNLTNNSNVSPYSIHLIGVKDTIRFTVSGLQTGDTLDFGSVCPNTVKDTSFTVNNNSSTSTSFSGTSLVAPFQNILPDPFQQPFDTLESRKINVRFTGSPTFGKYFASMIVADMCGRQKTIHMKVSIQNMSVHIDDSATICNGGGVYLDPAITGGNPPFSYSWDPTDGLDNPNVLQPYASPTSTTTYNLTITDMNGCLGYCSTHVYVYPEIIVQTGFNTNDTLCSQTLVTFHANASGGIPPLKYSWKPANIFDHPNSPNPSATFSQSTEIILDVIDSVLCVNSDTMNINVFSGLIVNASPDQNICIDSVTQIHGNIFGGKPPYTGINWYPPTGLSDPYSLDPIVNLTIPANYVYVLYAMDANGCTSFDTIRINVYPKLVIDAGHLISMCLGKPVSLNGSSVGGMPNVNFSWDPPDGLSDPHSLKPDITEDTPGTYSYVLTATDANQCIRRDTTTVIIYPNPKVEAGSDLTLCLGEKGRLNGSATDGTPPYLKIEWSPATGLSNPSIFDPVVDLTTPGTYKYYLKVSDLYDCSSTDSVSVIIIGVPPITLSSPTLDFGELDQCSTSKKDSITITDDGTLEILIDSVYFDDGFKLPPPQLPIRLIPGRPAKIYVDFVPSHVGLTTGNLHFLGNPCNVDITIQASGTQDKLLIKKDVTDLDFGKTFTCISVDSIQTMNLTNMGSTQIQFDFTQTGISPPFELVEPNGIVTLDPSLNLAVKVRYHPLSPGNFIEGARIPYIAGSCNDSITFTLTGNYIETNLTALYSKVAFPPIIDCQTFLDTIISVKNTGNVPLRIISVDTFPTFSTTDSLPIIIQPNESKQLAVIFTPQRVGNFTGFVKMKFDLCDVTDTLLLSGSKQGVVFKTTDTLDVGEFVVCRDKIITAFDSIINLAETGTYGMITSMTIDPPFRTNIGEGTHLPVKTTTQYQVYFEPDDTYPDGVITGKMKIIISPCNIEKTINLKARKTNVNISKEADLIFDPRQIGTDSIAEVRFKNTGTANVHVNSMNGVLPPYSIVSMLPAPPVWLAPGDEIVIKVKYSPVKEGVDSTTIVIGCNEPCTFTAGSYIGGQGLVNPPDLPPVDVTVYIPDTQDSTGHKVNIPITITAKKDLLDKKATGFYSEISFNKTILLPTDSTPMGITGTNTRKIILTGGINDTLFLMNFLVSLGDAEETLMTIDSISFTNVRTNITKRNGTFRLMDVCHEGGARLINPEGKLQLLLARPNPVTDNFELSYELIETGRTQLYMVNMTGEKIKMLLDEDIKAHCTNTLTVDTKELPSGSYLVILQTPNMRKSIMIVVMK